MCRGKGGAETVLGGGWTEIFSIRVGRRDHNVYGSRQTPLNITVVCIPYQPALPYQAGERGP